MSKNKAIPDGYMTVGELAKKMSTTVRTLQYYDREGLLKPSAESEGGRRLYTDKDIIRLHQLLSLKYLGFSLDDIKNQLIKLDTPADVAAALGEHAETIRNKIAALSESLEALEALRNEVLLMQSVDFEKYADIIVNLQMKNEMYWVIKHFDEQTLDYFRKSFDKETSQKMIDRTKCLLDEAIRLKNEKVPPESEEGQNFARAFWDMLLEFTGGDMSLLSRLAESAGSTEGLGSEWGEKQSAANSFIVAALDVYFTAAGYDPLKEERK